MCKTLPAVIVAALVLGLCSPTAEAQLKEAQERAWSGLKDAYALVVSMKDNKSNRTPSNFEVVLGKTLTSLADQKQYIAKMGEQVADEDKSYATGLRDNILDAMNKVVDAREKLKSAYEAAKDGPGKMEEISNELDTLKSAMENYDDKCRIAYNNYKARWEEIKSGDEKKSSEFQSLTEKIEAIYSQLKSMNGELQSMTAERKQVQDEIVKANDLLVDLQTRLGSANDKDKASYMLSQSDRQSAEEELAKAKEAVQKVIKLRVALRRRDDALGPKITRQEEDLEKKYEELFVVQDQRAKVPQSKRLTQWNAEFPAKSYSYQSLK